VPQPSIHAHQPLPLQACTLLLDRGGQVDAPNREGWTALHRAACNGAVGTARLLIHRGASLHGLTNNHATPLHLAAQYNQLTVMNLLLELGSRIDMRDKAGRTAADLCIGDGARALIQEHAEAAAAAGRPLVRERPQSVPK
jgi:ankyrin repeat protein